MDIDFSGIREQVIICSGTGGSWVTLMMKEITGIDRSYKFSDEYRIFLSKSNIGLL
jgi:hypothetical protein